MIDSFSAVKAICVYSDWGVSNLSVQKLLYISHMIHLGQKSRDEDSLKPLIRHKFYAWAYGPVVPKVYKELKMFGAGEVVNFSTLRDALDPEEEREEYQTIKYVCERLKGVKSGRLVSYTHDKVGAWRHLYNRDVPDTIIPNKEIYNEYRRRYPSKN